MFQLRFDGRFGCETGGAALTAILRLGEVASLDIEIQLDHIVPFAKGGANSAENLRLRCFAHNRLWAFEEYGAAKILRFSQKAAQIAVTILNLGDGVMR